ncbi:hypothetical protein HY732_04655 [Candidatus Uhrbacteria bacterium]|nr:hypothetical protein [Candidatus Uhrbacteria bacterium]
MKRTFLDIVHKITIGAVVVATLFPSTANIANAAEFTSAKLALSRVQASVTAVTDTWTLVMPSAVDWDGDTNTRDEIVIDYPASSVTFDAAADWGASDFTITDNGAGSNSVTVFSVTANATTFTYGTCASSGTNDAVVAVDVDDLRIGFKRCSDTFTTNGNGSTVTITISNEINNGTAATYVIPVTHDEDCGTSDTAGCGAAATDNSISAAIDIISDDQVATSASVDPTIDFELSVETSLCGASTSLASAGTLAIGTLSSASIGRNGYICTRLDTNATDGASVYVTSGGALISTSETGDKIPDTADTSMSEQTISAGTEEYGLCVSSSGSGTGAGSGATPTADADFDGGGTCTTSTGTVVGELTTATEQVWSVNGPTVNAFANLNVFAAVSTLTEAHTDYADTLTFTVASTF